MTLVVEDSETVKWADGRENLGIVQSAMSAELGIDLIC